MATKSLGTLTVTLKALTKDFNTQLGSARQKLQNAQAGLQGVAVAAGATTAAMALFGKSAVTAFSNFEKEMMIVRGVTQNLGEEGAENFRKLEKAALEQSKRTQYTAQQTAEAMKFMGQAGADTSMILKNLPGVLDLAAAGALDLGRAADIATNVLAGYGDGVKDLATVNDVLVSASTGANTNIDQLGEAMKYAAPVANSAGVKFQEAAAAIALMGNAGIQGSMAGTSLRGAISRLLSPTDSITDTLKSLGVSVTDSNGRLLGLSEIIRQLEPHASNTGAMMEIFGMRAGPAMAALVQQGADSLDGFTKRLDEAKGVAGELATAQLQTFWGAMQQVGSQAQALSIRIGKALAPAVRFVGEIVGSTADYFSGLSDTMIQVIVAIGGAVTVLSGLAAALSVVGLMLPGFIAGWTLISATIIPSAIGGIAALSKTVGGLMLKLAPLAGSIALVVAAFAAGAAIVYGFGQVLKSYQGMISKIINWIATNISKTLGKALQWLNDALITAYDFWSKKLGLAGGPNKIKINADIEVDEDKKARKDIEDLQKELRKAAKEASKIKINPGAVPSVETKSAKSTTPAASTTAETAAPATPLRGPVGPRIDSARLSGAGATSSGAAGILIATETTIVGISRAFDSMVSQMTEAAGIFAQRIKNNLGTMGQMIDAGMQGFEQGGPAGALAAVSAEIIMSTEAFAVLVEQLNSVFGVLFDALNPLISTAIEPLLPVFHAVKSLLGNVVQVIEPLIPALRTFIKLFADRLVTQFKIIVTLLNALMPIIEALGPILDILVRLFFAQMGPGLQMLAKAVEMLAPVINAVAKVIALVINGISGIFNGIIGAIASVLKTIGRFEIFGERPFGFLVGWANNLEKSKVALVNFTKETKDATDSQGDIPSSTDRVRQGFNRVSAATESATSAISNAPSGFKVAAARFRAAQAETPGAFDGAASATMTRIEKVQIVSNDPLEIWRKIKKLQEYENFTNSGTPAGTDLPFMTPANGGATL